MENLRNQLASLSSDELLAKLPNMLEAADAEFIDLHAQISALKACVMVLVTAQGSSHPEVFDGIIKLLENVSKITEDKNSASATNYVSAYDSLRDEVAKVREAVQG